jgi:hypothetical protein
MSNRVLRDQQDPGFSFKTLFDPQCGFGYSKQWTRRPAISAAPLSKTSTALLLMLIVESRCFGLIHFIDTERLIL